MHIYRNCTNNDLNLLPIGTIKSNIVFHKSHQPVHVMAWTFDLMVEIMLEILSKLF